MPFRWVRRIIIIIALMLATPPLRAEATLQCSHLPQLFEFYLKYHYLHKKLTDEIKTHTVEQYVKNLDPSKTLLLDGDVTTLKNSLMGMFKTLPAGNCNALDEGTKLLAKRAAENETFVKSFLGPSYRIDDSVEVMLDPRKRNFSKTTAEQQEGFELTDMKLPEAKKQLIHRYELVTKRLSERKPDDTIASYAEAFALALDPHSGFLSRDNLEDFQIQMQLSLEGIGASLTNQDGFTVIEELIPGGGAEKSKQLHPKDKIIAVSQENAKPVNVIDMDLRDVVKLIRGKKNTKVKLTILRQDPGPKTFDVTIVRDKIDIKEQAAKISYENRKVGDRTLKIGIIDLPSFYGGGAEGTRSSSVDVKQLLDEARKEKVDGILLNLSRNGGGLLEEAVRISGLFIVKGAVVATKDADAKVQVLSDQDDDVSYSGPLVLLTSRFSASASEILAGALRDYKRAVIIGGDHTFGKGTVQVVSGLPLNLGGMKVTTGMFFLPGGESTQQAGVPADVHLPSPYASDDVGENTLDYSLPKQSISNFVSPEADVPQPPKHWDPVNDSVIKKLVTHSQERVAKDPKFAEIKKNLEEANKNGVIKLAEIRKKSEAEKKKNKKEKKAEDTSAERAAKELESPLVRESVNILIDLINSGTSSKS